MAKRRDVKRYRENPWIEKAAIQTVVGNRIITAKGNDDKKFIVSPDTGEIEGFTGFYTRQEVDKTHFLKLYADGIRALTGLSTAGMKVFILVYDKVTSNEGFNKDTIMLNYEMLSDDEKAEFGLRTFQRGITDLINHEFLAETLQIGVYFINPTFIYNGNRLAIVNEYIMKPVEPPKKEVKKIKHIPTEILKSARSRVATANQD